LLGSTASGPTGTTRTANKMNYDIITDFKINSTKQFGRTQTNSKMSRSRSKINDAILPRYSPGSAYPFAGRPAINVKSTSPSASE
jgi:hypothetical protein